MWHKSAVCRAVVLVVGVGCQAPASANNGFNLIGFGAESVTMGGADIAVARDTSALNSNPAGLSQLQGRRLDLHSALAYVTLTHGDRFDNHVGTANRWGSIANFGYAAPVLVPGLTAGLGVFAQGGAGARYRDLDTAFGTRDDLAITFGVVKFTAGAAYRINPQFSVGGSVALAYSQFDQKVFPETSFHDPADPTRSFFGFEIRDASGLSPGFKFGLQYRATPTITLGLAYTHETALDLDGDRFTANYSALGLGKVTYRNVELRGIDLARELGFGIAVRPNDRWLIAMDLAWIDWSRAVHEGTLTATNPDNAAAPARVDLTAFHHWRDQWVLAVGVAYEPDSRSIYRFGYNHARNPIPDENLNPLLPQIGEQHVTFGVGFRLGQQWRFDGGFEYLLPNEVVYTNPRSPFGENARLKGSYLAIHSSFSRTW